MSPELDEMLVVKYPKIFGNRFAGTDKTLMCWGFSHDDGWYNIIDMMCANIQSHIDWSRRQRMGALLYNRALHRAIHGDFSTYNRLSKWQQKSIDDDLLDPEPQLRHIPKACPQVVAVQVKEKFGTLRFYYDGGDDYIRGIVSMAESMSSCMCEECGAPGTTAGTGWIRTLCEIHRDET